MKFDPGKQCHWCGSERLSTTIGYAGERQCLVCGWGGDGEPDVPCMFYKIAGQLTAASRHGWASADVNLYRTKGEQS